MSPVPEASRGYSGKLADPAVRHERASRAGKSRTGVAYHIRKLVESANTLTAEQAEELRQLLPTAG
jgi:hypothetical protein